MACGVLPIRRLGQVRVAAVIAMQVLLLCVRETEREKVYLPFMTRFPDSFSCTNEQAHMRVFHGGINNRGFKGKLTQKRGYGCMCAAIALQGSSDLPAEVRLQF